MLEFPQEDKNGFFYFSRDIEQLLFSGEDMDRNSGPLLFANGNTIHFPLPESGPIIEKVKLLFL